ncbi:MAG: hypothetical protein M3O50_13780, partial [Myxococcota bacterium]|nr:hypothetical protein [Myxococcota bacterium]
MNHRGSGLQTLASVLVLGAVWCACASGSSPSTGGSPFSGDTPAFPARPVGTDAAAGATRADASFRKPDPLDARDEYRTDGTGDSLAEAALDVLVGTLPDAPREARADAQADSARDTATGATADAAKGAVADASGAGPPCNGTADPKDTPCVIDDAYGVFVSGSGADGAAGTMADPLKTISAGIARAVKVGKTRVYACRGSYAESVVLDSAHDGLEIYGGFVCVGGWRWTGEKAQVQPESAPRYALRVESTTKPTLLQDLAFASGDPRSSVGQSVAPSSVAAFVQGTSLLTLVRVQLHAGAGAYGQDALPVASNVPLGVAIDLAGNVGSAGGPPGAPKRCVCASWGESTGGAGGSPSNTTGGDGAATPPAVPDPSSGKDGLGGGALPPPLSGCFPGDTGANGSIQTGGGRAAQSLGSVTLN